jgi:hypothetical protein
VAMTEKSMQQSSGWLKTLCLGLMSRTQQFADEQQQRQQ